MVKVIIGMTDEYTKKITMECVTKALPKAQLIDGSSDGSCATLWHVP